MACNKLRRHPHAQQPPRHLAHDRHRKTLRIACASGPSLHHLGAASPRQHTSPLRRRVQTSGTPGGQHDCRCWCCGCCCGGVGLHGHKASRSRFPKQGHHHRQSWRLASARAELASAPRQAAEASCGTPDASCRSRRPPLPAPPQKARLAATAVARAAAEHLVSVARQLARKVKTAANTAESATTSPLARKSQCLRGAGLCGWPLRVHRHRLWRKHSCAGAAGAEALRAMGGRQCRR